MCSGKSKTLRAKNTLRCVQNEMACDCERRTASECWLNSVTDVDKDLS